MSKGVNKVILIGNLGADPEIRHTQTGAPIVTINMATSEAWRDKKTNAMQEKTEWHRVVFYLRLAEIAAEYLKKGALVFVEGSVHTRKWKDKSNVDHYSTEIKATQLQMLSHPLNKTENFFEEDIPQTSENYKNKKFEN